MSLFSVEAPILHRAIPVLEALGKGAVQNYVKAEDRVGLPINLFAIDTDSSVQAYSNNIEDALQQLAFVADARFYAEAAQDMRIPQELRWVKVARRMISSYSDGQYSETLFFSRDMEGNQRSIFHAMSERTDPFCIDAQKGYVYADLVATGEIVLKEYAPPPLVAA